MFASGGSRIFHELGMPILQGGGRQHTILPNVPKNYMKWKEFGSGGGVPRGPLRSATVWVMKHLKGAL